MDRHSLRNTGDGGESDEQTRRLTLACAQLLKDDKCEDVLVLDLRGQSQVTEYFVIASGTSQRQMRSTGKHVEELYKDQGRSLLTSNLRDRESSWYILDFGDVVVHLFEPETRLFYDIEMLWGDAERIPWSREEGGVATDRARNRAGLRDDEVLPES